MSRDDLEALMDETEAKLNGSSRAPRKGSALAGLALLLALVSMLLSGWVWWTSRGGVSDDALAALADQVAPVAEQQAALRAEINALKRAMASQENSPAAPSGSAIRGAIEPLDQEIGTLSATSSELRGRLEQLESQVQSTGSRVNNLERGLANLDAVTRGNDEQLARAEVEYLLRLGNERLALFNDRDAALRTLELADHQLELLNDPALAGVRQQLNRDQVALRAVKLPDYLGLASELEALETQSTSWPVRQPRPQKTETVDAEEGGLIDRAADTLKGLVTVRKTNSQELEFLTIEEGQKLTQRIQLELQTARMAVQRRDDAQFQASLERVQTWLGRYFDSESADVEAAFQSLESLRASTLNPTLPDISGSLRQMSYLMASPQSEPAPLQSAPPVAAPVSASEPDSSSASDTLPEIEAESDPAATPEESESDTPDPADSEATQ